MTNQELLLKEIRKQLSSSASLNDEISAILNISYDAAHRRVSGKSKFSIDETLLLANHFNISLDKLFLKKDKVIVEKTIEITSLNDMLSYFKKSAERIEQLANKESVTLYYSAKDIPLFYFMDGTIISKFKAYVWLTLLNPNQSNVSFENFIIDESFMEHTQKLKKIYEKVAVKEVWNDTTINSSLQQILYFYESGLLNFKSAKALCLDLKRILNLIKDKSNKSNSNYSIYYNELILLNNNMLIETDEKLTMFIPYTLLGYFITDNKESCKNVHQFFNQQILNSKALNQSGIKEQNLFFNRANRKIEYYIERLNNQVDLLF
ncbi:helix-turn-helix transcriptional regulator [Flavobacterium chungnamense]|uniref:Transcription regulator BetR N-terminal domain-containing protein n=1 Tax=Flavobacterium chungnamense TaxID=706182 RepID=A0ABP7UQ70_9FLAO